ncbi:hypothetical protein EI94DRAFT_974010 [Lactarius quietus]|nr:hypothetical protein EI94DRAFT_974010 [Lactarius quietus]
MATTQRSRSRDYDQPNTTDIRQSDDSVDRASHRGANGAGKSPYSSSTRRGYGSAVELHEHVADANSAANSGQPSWGQRPYPASRRTFAPQTAASKIFQHAAYADAEQDAPYRVDPPRRSADVPQNPTAPVLSESSSMSSGLPAPNGSYVTQRGGVIPGPLEASRSTMQANVQTHTVTCNPTSKDTPRQSRTMPLNAQSHAATSPSASKNTTKPSRNKVRNDPTSDEPSQGEKAGSGPPQAEEAPRGMNSIRSESQGVNPPSLVAETLAKQDGHPPPPPKDLPTSGRSLAPSASGVAKSYSRRPQETAPVEVEPQALHGRLVPPEAPVFHEGRETVPLNLSLKKGHDPLNGQLAPNSASSPRAAADHHTTPSFPVAEHRPPTPPQAVATRSNSPSLLRVDRSGSEYNHGTNESRDRPESLNSAAVIGITAVTETSPTVPPVAYLRPNGLMGRNSSKSSLALSGSDEGRGHSSRPAEIERRQSSRHTGGMSRSVSRRPPMEECWNDEPKSGTHVVFTATGRAQWQYGRWTATACL